MEEGVFHGNALVVGIVEKIADSLPIVETKIPQVPFESRWIKGKGSQKLTKMSFERKNEQEFNLLEHL